MAKFSGEKLREILQERGMSQAKLAREMKVNPRVVCRYCHGQRKPKIDTLMLMAQILRVPVSALVTFPRYEEGGDV